MNRYIKYVTLALAALLILTIAVMVCLTIPSKAAGAADALTVRERTTGSSWGFKFWDPPGMPHYGTSFRGSKGADPNFTGAGGNGATAPFSGGIKAWNWWGGELGTLLTPKEWICGLASLCPADRRDPKKYNAVVTR